MHNEEQPFSKGVAAARLSLSLSNIVSKAFLHLPRFCRLSLTGTRALLCSTSSVALLEAAADVIETGTM
jgi:hypothetical protein